MIVPGSVNPFLLAGAADPLDELGVIARSLRFRNPASAYLNRTFGAGNQKTWTWFGWVKRCEIGIGSTLFSQGSGVLVNGYGGIHLTSNNTIQIVTSIDGTTASMIWESTQVFRDPAAHYFFTVAVDTTQASSANRLKVWCNGSLVNGSFSVTPSLNADLQINRSGSHYVGVYNPNGLSGYFDGYQSFTGLVGGQGLTPSSFGQLHPITGQWRSKTKAQIQTAVNAGGTNSFFLDFGDPTNTTTLVTDVSSNGNNWTANNISLTAGSTYDSMLDTPTNNYCTLDPIVEIGPTSRTISNGALDISASYSGGVANFGSQPVPISGKWYWEVTVGTIDAGNTAPIIGVLRANSPGASSYDYTNGCGYRQNGSKQTSSGVTAYGASFTTNDVIGVAMDMDAGTVSFYKNGVSQGVALSGLSVQVKPAFISSVNTTSAAFNFGQRTFTYTPPAGFKAICTKNLPFPSIPKATNAFVAATDTGANITATLDAAASQIGSNWIKIYKRRDSAEGWRWQFSDDAANYMDSSSTAAKAAFPALSGSSYFACALKVAASNGIATGRLTHVNGVADVVADGLANTRKAVILKNEATGVWYFYHPDLTAGKLLYLEQITAETTDATISAVTSGGFTVAAALASGTYRWISGAEMNGFLKLLAYSGNGSSDGPFSYLAQISAFNATKKTNGGGDDWQTHDIATSPSNVAGASLRLNTSGAETSSTYLMDMDAAGLKFRQGGSNGNESGGTYVGLSIAAFPFRYANAR